MKTFSIRDVRLLFLAWTLFVVSFGCPSLGEIRGYQCAFAASYIWTEFVRGQWMTIHYLFLTLANFVMLASPFFLRFEQVIPPKYFRYAVIGAAVSVGSFAGLILPSADRKELGIGFYLWVASFAALYLAVMPHLRMTRAATGVPS